jgi:hypothetical protein
MAAGAASEPVYVYDTALDLPKVTQSQRARKRTERVKDFFDFEVILDT